MFLRVLKALCICLQLCCTLPNLIQICSREPIMLLSSITYYNTAANIQNFDADTNHADAIFHKIHPFLDVCK